MQLTVLAGLNEWKAKLRHPARRHFGTALYLTRYRQTPAAEELLYWTWANCELSQGNVDKAKQLVERGLQKVNNSGSLKLLQCEVRLQCGLIYVCHRVLRHVLWLSSIPSVAHGIKAARHCFAFVRMNADVGKCMM